jgi:toluene monooxygenase system protein E
MVEGILDEYSDANHDESLSPAWRTALSFLFTPTRFPAHAAQMCEVYFGQLAPSSYITNAAAFSAGDFYRRNSLISYRTRELEQSCPGTGFGVQERAIWETEEAWQPAREAFERVLVAYDWAEAFTALNLVLLPTIDDLLLRQVGQSARDHNDELTWLLLSNLEIDAARRDRWSVALVRFALEQRPENHEVLRRWIDKWTPRAEVAARGIAEMLESLPERGRRADISATEAREARLSLLADAGMNLTEG